MTTGADGPRTAEIQARIAEAEERVRRGPDGTETFATAEALASWIEALSSWIEAARAELAGRERELQLAKELVVAYRERWIKARKAEAEFRAVAEAAQADHDRYRAVLERTARHAEDPSACDGRCAEGMLRDAQEVLRAPNITA